MEQRIAGKAEDRVRIKIWFFRLEQVWDEKLTDLAQTAVQNDTKVLVMGKGDRLTEGKMKIVCLHPDQEYDQEKGNEASMVWIFPIKIWTFC